jgi:Carbohydrate family 9 binding domain-like
LLTEGQGAGARILCRRAEIADVNADASSGWWQAVPPVFLREAVTGGAPKQATSLRVAWNGDELRVLFEADDTDPWATHTERDAPLYDEEVIEVFLDPVGDLESYFEMEVNPLNAVLDLVLRKNRSGYLRNFAWRCEGLRTAAKRTARGWTAEFAIPFRAVTSNMPVKGTRWRANFYRIDRPKGEAWELSAWSPTGRPTFHVPERFGLLEFSD